MEQPRSWPGRILLTSAALVAVTSLSLAAAPPAAAAATTTTSGWLQDGFEAPVLAPDSFALFSAGQPMGAWTVTSGDVHLIGAGFWQAAEGSQSLDLDGGQRGAVAMDLPTVPLFVYRVSYSLAGNPVAGPTVKTGTASVNGGLTQSFSFDITGKTRTDMGYVRKSFHFLATSHTSTLEFASTTTPAGWGPVIDDVVVRACLLIICPGHAAAPLVRG